MKLSNLLKKGSLQAFATATVATVATLDPRTPLTVATVATVAVATLRKQAANDSKAVATDAVSAKPERLSSVLAVPSPAVLEEHDSSIALTEDPDLWCWPHSSAMNCVEIDRFTGRVLRLQNLGVDLLKAEGLAETLLKRDREADDRRMCAECSNLVGRQCRNPQGAELGLPSHRTADVSPIRFMLQRCAGFRGDGLTIGNRKPEAGMSSHEIIAA